MKADKLINEVKKFLNERQSKIEKFLLADGFGVFGGVGSDATTYQLVTDEPGETVQYLKDQLKRFGYKQTKENIGREYEASYDANGRDGIVSFVTVNTSSPGGSRLPTVSVSVFYE